MVRIRMPDTTEAVLDGRRWRCESARLERILNSMVAPWGLEPGEAPEEREAREAEIASKVLGAEIVDAEPDTASRPEGG